MAEIFLKLGLSLLVVTMIQEEEGMIRELLWNCFGIANLNELFGCWKQ